MPRSRSRSLLSIARSCDLLVVAERAGLLQQPVDQGRLAVVDVRDDRDVAQVHMARSGGRIRQKRAGGLAAAPHI